LLASYIGRFEPLIPFVDCNVRIEKVIDIDIPALGRVAKGYSAKHVIHVEWILNDTEQRDSINHPLTLTCLM
jgi:hypothetical protein